jgi:predicted nucleic acid-binding Zn ribbon protein
MVSKSDKNLKDVLEQLYKAYGWTEKMDGVRIINAWDKVVGSIIAKHTLNLYVKNRILYVDVDSSALKNEIFMERSVIARKLNDEIGKKVINEIILT